MSNLTIRIEIPIGSVQRFKLHRGPGRGGDLVCNNGNHLFQYKPMGLEYIYQLLRLPSEIPEKIVFADFYAGDASWSGKVTMPYAFLPENWKITVLPQLTRIVFQVESG